MKGEVAQMKLSTIVGRHQDPLTDHLYQPLRAAIQGLNTPNSHQIFMNKQNNPLFKSELKRSQFPVKVIQHQQIVSHLLKQKESTMFPQNMRLVPTNNPLKRMKARSRSYRAISVEETFGRPLNSGIFRQKIKVHPASKKEIVYDYDPQAYQQQSRPFTFPQFHQNLKMPARARSETYVGLNHQIFTNRVERVESTTMVVNRKPPETHGSNNSIKTNSYYTKQSQGKEMKQQKDIVTRKSPDFSSEYYQHCNKYTFNRGFKSSSREGQPEDVSTGRQAIGQRSPRSNSNYKYNLFSMMDEQTNLNCQNGFCTKNELVAPRIKKRW